jgi:hypothetical protein
MTKSIVRNVTRSKPIEQDDVKVGQWYWVKRGKKEEPWLGCVIDTGSNYFELDGPNGGPERVHADEFESRCAREKDPDSIIDRQVESARARVDELMGEVRALTARLAVGGGPELGTGEECLALAVATEGRSYSEYSKALEKAKKEDLPALFKQIEEANRTMATWMSAKVIPLKAEAEGMKGVIEKIEDRVFNVELYAGLVERVVVCQDGEPAPLTEKIRLLQRRHYMDEECLAQYEVGGMEMKDIESFDRWICRTKNRDRLLPFQRCAVAFRVRRNAKWREGWSISDFLQIFHLEQEDKTTFLYIRNGERVYRLETQIEFGEQLFPDIRQLRPHDAMWAEVWSSGSVHSIISEGEYLEKKRQYEAEEAERERQYKEAPRSERYRFQFPVHDPVRDFRPFNQTNVYYDDISADIQGKLKKHNRIALILQGLLDRSPVFHPHPPWQIWTEEGFHQALELVHDDSLVLPSGPPPDFEAYRKRLNKALKPGCVTIGQQDFWERHEAQKENRRREGDYRNRGRIHEVHHHRPYGNPGPGELARPVLVNKVGKCTYGWNRRRQVETWGHRFGELIPVRFEVPASRLLCADAYEPGDFKAFFDDPRTRADYLKWAPVLLEAEEYKAGNRKVGPKED